MSCNKPIYAVILFVSLTLSISSVFGSSAMWSQTFGGIKNDLAYSLIETSDRGFVIAGITDSFGNGQEIWLIKTDGKGNAEWNQTYGPSTIFHLSDGLKLIETFDGGYAIASGTRFVKIDKNGNMIWNQTYEGSEYEHIHSFIQTKDGGYALTGSLVEGDLFYGTTDCWFIKTDVNGNLEWNQTYGETSFYEEANSLVMTSDGGYVLAGTTGSIDGGNGDFWLVKTDSSGNMEWNRAYGGAATEVANSLIQINEEGFVIVGSTTSFGSGYSDFWLVKTDQDGNIQLNRTYGGNKIDVAFSIVLASDGGFGISGYTYSFGAGESDFLLVKTDSNGIMEWNQTQGGAGYDFLTSMIETSDGNYVLAGYTGSLGAGAYDFWLVKIMDQSNTQELLLIVFVAAVLFVLALLIIFRWGFT